MTRTTGPVTIDGKKYKEGLAGASLVARDGTYPMRALIRCVALTHNRIWHRKARNHKQSMFMPQDLHIAHVILYAVRPELIHEHLLYVEPNTTEKIWSLMCSASPKIVICANL